MTKAEMRKAEMDNLARAYNDAHYTLLHIRDAIRARQITLQEARTLRGQALAGDVDGAERGLAKIIRREQ